MQEHSQQLDVVLIEAAQQGDADSFGALVERYWRWAYAVAYVKVGDRDLAEDIAQDAFYKAYVHIRSLRDARRFRGWLREILLRECTSQQRQYLRAAVGTLPEKYQQVILLRFFAALTPQEIARQQGKRVGTVRVWLHRGCRMLRERLAPMLGEVHDHGM